MSYENILLVGSGNLGSRHLQALLAVSGMLNILVVEPSKSSRDLSISRISETTYSASEKQISFYESLSELPSTDFKICILSTSANERLPIVCDLISCHKFEYMILEKVAFQSGHDFKRAITILEGKTKAFVNCPRRLDPLYKFIKSYIVAPDKISLHVSGKNWGLGSNTVHFLDLWHFLSEIKAYSSDLSGLEKKLYPSKRNNYIDIHGKMIFSSADSSLSLESKKSIENEASLEIIINDGSRIITIDQVNQQVSIYEDDIEIDSISFPQMPVSLSTKYVVEDIIKNGNCELPSLSETHLINLDFLNSLLIFCNNLPNNNFSRCPIT